MKTCTECLLDVPLDRFYRYKRGTLYSACKKCHNARMAKRHRDNPDVKRRSNWLQRGIDITAEQYQELHDLQVGKCAICGRAEASGRRLAVDHDHETGHVRGLLCTKCNTTVGWVEMHPSLIRYLDHSKGVTHGHHPYHI